MLHREELCLAVGVRIPTAVILPDANAMQLYGIEPTILTREDMASSFAWYKLAVKHDPYLDRRDFVEEDTFIKYYLLSLGLLEYSVTLIGGSPGGGKSLVMAYLTYQMTRLFGKRATLDWTPPKPDRFGTFFSLYDEAFTDKIQSELNRLARVEKERRMTTGEAVSQEELESLIVYNTVFGLDECDQYAERASRTNLTKLIGRLINRRRHFYMCMLMVYVNPQRADRAMVYDNHTHEIVCGFDWFPKSLPGYCSYIIRDVRQNGTGISKWLHLNPAEHTDLWHSHNIVSISHNVRVNLGGQQKKAKSPEYEN